MIHYGPSWSRTSPGRKPLRPVGKRQKSYKRYLAARTTQLATPNNPERARKFTSHTFSPSRSKSKPSISATLCKKIVRPSSNEPHG
jgi:hypothetical protein